jgi:hypothetical protein
MTILSHDGRTATAAQKDQPAADRNPKPAKKNLSKLKKKLDMPHRGIVFCRQARA